MRVAGSTIASAALLLTVSCAPQTIDFTQSDLGLLAYWPLDEARAGDPVRDASGFGQDGTLAPDHPPIPSTDVAPVHFANPRSLSFNGLDQWVSLANPPLLNVGGPITLAAWVKANEITAVHTIVTHGYRTSPNFDLGLRLTGGQYEFAYWDGRNHAARAAIPLGDRSTWVHLCGTFDGTSYNLYRNGVLLTATADNVPPPPDADTYWSIGAKIPMPVDLERVMDGKIDEVRIYGRALAPDEVRALARR